MSCNRFVGAGDSSQSARVCAAMLIPALFFASMHVPTYAADASFAFIATEFVPTIDRGNIALGGPSSVTLQHEHPSGAYGVFANESGRVRAFVGLSGVDPAEGTTKLVWRKTFRKGSEDDVAHFTVNRSYLDLKLSDSTYDCCPSASLSMTVTLYDPKRTEVVLVDRAISGKAIELSRTPQVQFAHIAEITPSYLEDDSEGGSIVLADERTRLFGSYVWDQASAVVPGNSPVVNSTFTSDGFGDQRHGRYEMGPYRGEIDLGTIEVGGLYTIEYQIFVSVEHDGGEFSAEAFLGDPLDVDSGFTLETTSAAANDQAPATMCNVQSDASRFRYDAANTTVTDVHTGLMWQRCPLGYTVDSQSTVEVVSDDQCVMTGIASMNWVSALQRSASDALASHTDWRLPNIKELDSIVELGCHLPTIDSAPFPGTPLDFFWSSTPGLTGDTARAIDFGMGFSSPRSKSSAARVRLVRTTDQPALEPLPSIKVGSAVSQENDANLVFPVELDRSSTSAVTVNYATGDHTAVAGEDYVATSGTLTIPPGLRRAEVVVPVIDNAVAEGYESLYLVLRNVSSSARLIVDSNLGQINDDEPLVSIAPTSVTERHAGTSPMSFTATLSKAAAAVVSINYATANGTATAGLDYTAATGTLLIPAGSTSGLITISVLGDTQTESDENLSVTLTSVSTNARLSPSQSQAQGFIIDDDVITLRALNDTGVVQCADTSSPAKPCAQTAAFPGQDAQFGRDVTNNNSGDGVAGFSFTKLDANGTPLVNEAASYTVMPWDCVRDEVTGLYWEVKTDNGGLRDKDWLYSWFNSTGSNDGGSAGTANGGVCVDGSNCDTEKYVNAVNALGMCGRNDWRMPTREELQSIIDVGDRAPPPYDTGYFANPPASRSTAHWTSTPDASEPNVAWTVTILQGRAAPIFSKSRGFPVRLVRAGN